MEKEVLQYLIWRIDGTYVDATMGDGGHAALICSNLQYPGKLIGFDWDKDALERASERLKPFAERVILVHDSYTNLERVLSALGFSKIDGVLIDLGASTIQLMDPGRGFSFHHEGDLDMRMDRRSSLTARDIVNRYPEEDLATIFFRYGEERWSKKIAARLIRAREQEGPITDSRQLAELVKDAIPARFRRHGGHPARRIFQALRLEVNRELENISALLPQAVGSLAPGGRICIIAYHSLEDRLIKNYFREKARLCSCPPGRPCICGQQADLKILTAKAVKPLSEEIENNPRSRSARLRVAEKL
jgi:16S rRNA (cytosine1402-N4)-methyltransferase